MRKGYVGLLCGVALSLALGLQVSADDIQIQYRLDDKAIWNIYNGEIAIQDHRKVYYRTANFTKGIYSDVSEVEVLVDNEAPMLNGATKSPNAEWGKDEVTLAPIVEDNMTGHVSGYLGGSGVEKLKYQIGSGAELYTTDSYVKVTVKGKLLEAPVKISAIDKAGNESVVGVYDIKLDDINPTTPKVTLSDNSEWLNKPVNMGIKDTGDVGSGVDRLEYNLNGSWLTYTGEITVDVPDNTAKEMKIKTRSVDKAGGVSPEVEQIIRMDKIKPLDPIHLGLTYYALASDGTKINLTSGEWINKDVYLQVKSSDFKGNKGRSPVRDLAYEAKGVCKNFDKSVVSGETVWTTKIDSTQNVKVATKNTAGTFSDSNLIEVRIDKLLPDVSVEEKK